MLIPLRSCRGVAIRNGYTLIELVFALAIVSVLTAIAVRSGTRIADSIAVRAASAEAYAQFGVARQLAVLRGRMTVLEIDTARGSMLVRADQDTLRLRQLREVHGVRLQATRLASTYATNGLGYGVSNLTLVIRRGHAADTLVVSRLGRVRR